MEINIRINGSRYTSLEAIREIGIPGLTEFLQEWYNPEEHVTGHTSGSTGTPKTICLSKQDMIASAKITNEYFKLHADSRLLLCLSPDYIAGKMMIVRNILAGSDLIAVKPSSSPLQEIEQTIDFAAMVPMQVEMSLNSPNTAQKLASVRQLIIGGAAISPSLAARLQQIPTRCYCTYGMTETVSHIALRDINGTGYSSGYFALGKVQFSTDERGCLVIHAPHLHQHTFTTNDAVRLIDATHFEWLGRQDHAINSGGIKLFPETIEVKIAPFIDRRFFITSEPDNVLGEKAILVIEDSTWNTTKQAYLEEQLKQTLSPYERPKTIYFKKHFAETYSGKIIRKLM